MTLATATRDKALANRGLRGLVCVSVLIGLVAGFGPAAALALPKRGHSFAFAFGSAGSGEGEFAQPSAVALNQSDGDVYVADYANNRVEVFEPQLGSEGKLIGERYSRSISVPLPTAIAVDSSTESSDASRGDIYVVGSTHHEVREEEPNKRIFKLSPEGQELALLRKFAEPHEESEEFEQIEGLQVDRSGELYVYDAGSVDAFSNAEPKNKGLFSVPAPVRATRGFALDSQGNFYVGHESENPELVGPPPVVGKVEGLTGAPLIAELDRQAAAAVAVNTADVATNGVDEENDAYIANVEGGTGALAAFSPDGSTIQRFGAPGLKEPSGIAVDERTGTLYVTDAASNSVDVFELEPPGAPSVEGPRDQVLAPSAGEANAVRLQAHINPDGAETSYSFQYGTSSCSSSECTKTAETDIGAGFSSQVESLELKNLPPGTYHYRAAATNANGSGESTEQTFTILAQASGLPDGRAWEMVSPPNKHGAPIEAPTREGGSILAAEDGGALTYVANGAIEDEVQGNRSFEPQQILSTRTPTGWISEDIATPNARAAGSNFGAPEYQVFSGDLSLALVQPYVVEPSLAPEVTGAMTYLRDDPPIAPGEAERESYREAEANNAFLSPGFLPLVTRASSPELSPSASLHFLAATPDLGHVVVKGAELQGPASPNGLYEWSHGGGLQFLSTLPDGRPQPASSLALGYYQVRAHAISDNGSRVIWTAAQESPAHLYMRDLAAEKTIQLDKSQFGSELEGAARFQTASTDGSRIFFTDDEALLAGASGEPARDVSDLYECEIAEAHGELTCLLHDLTIPLHADEHAAVQGSVLGASEDGSTIFVVAKGVLAESENPEGEAAQNGNDNLYELRDTPSGWTRAFVAALSPEDAPDWDAGPNVSDENAAFQTARVSPNGSYVAFMSERSLTGYDNEDVSSEHAGDRLDQEVYLYDSGAASLTCVSCSPAGTRPTGVLDHERAGEGIGLLVDRRESWRGHWLAGSIPGWTSQSLTNALYQSRYLSNQGRLFFDSANPLVAGIAAPLREEEIASGKNQSVGVENVYEYEPSGMGGCTSTRAGAV